MRSRIGRLFEHGVMVTASNRLIGAVNEKLKTGPPPQEAERRLQDVAKAFVRSYQEREEADYDTLREWTRVEVWDVIKEVANAFEAWDAVRETPEAQAWLVSLLVRKSRY